MCTIYNHIGTPTDIIKYTFAKDKMFNAFFPTHTSHHTTADIIDFYHTCADVDLKRHIFFFFINYSLR